MPCYHPLKGWLESDVDEGKKRCVVFTKQEGAHWLPTTVPCGKCVGCRLERARMWSIRCVHEASLYQKNCFITLTFDDQHISKNGSLIKKDFQLFMKRLRKAYGEKIRFFHVGEYGSQLQRPHHHACIFNHDFEDKILFTIRNNVKLYVSSQLEKLWNHQGFCTVGEVTAESAAYIAGYCLKKVSGKEASFHYKQKISEYNSMSRNPGIGAKWLEQFHDDVYNYDHIILDGGFKSRPPRFYDKNLDKKNPQKLLQIKNRRIKMSFNNPHNTPERLAVREDIAIRKQARKERTYENAS